MRDKGKTNIHNPLRTSLCPRPSSLPSLKNYNYQLRLLVAEFFATTLELRCCRYLDKNYVKN
jgi:hypothetical protein